MIHNVPLGEGNFKVSVDVVLDEGSELPIPIKSGPSLVSDAVGTIVGWPKELVTLPTKKKNVKPQTFALSDVPGNRDKFKEIEKTLPMACKYIYSYAVRLMPEDESIHIDFDEAMFGSPKSVWLLRDDILRFMEMKEIGARQILVYMRYVITSPTVAAGSGCLPSSIFVTEKENDGNDTRLELVKSYGYPELGKKLEMLRPEKKKGKWFSLQELNERLVIKFTSTNTWRKKIGLSMSHLWIPATYLHAVCVKMAVDCRNILLLTWKHRTAIASASSHTTLGTIGS